MNAIVDKRRSGIGLALSGGGYRATLFHLGVLRRLAELGVLEQVAHFSSVSGGSITAGAVAVDLVTHPTSTWSARVDRITAQLRQFCSRTVDTGTIVGGVLNPFRSVSDLLAKEYKALYGDVTLGALKGVMPTFTFCATNLQTGRLVHMTPEYVVDYRIGRAPVDVALRRAVAASSAFPPFLSPVIIDTSKVQWTPTRRSTLTNDAAYNRRLLLTDGGAYDNMGLEPVWDDYEHVLVSDAGAPYVPDGDPGTDWFTQLHCAFEIATDQARGVRKRWLIDQFERGTARGAYWGINTNIADYELDTALKVAPATIERMARMRTRLNAFKDEEQELLINWGYAVSDAALRRRCPPLCRNQAAPVLPHPARLLA